MCCLKGGAVREENLWSILVCFCFKKCRELLIFKIVFGGSTISFSYTIKMINMHIVFSGIRLNVTRGRSR